MRNKAIIDVKELGCRPLSFKASSGWISRVLTRHGKVGINLHGDASNMTTEERERDDYDRLACDVPQTVGGV